MYAYPRVDHGWPSPPTCFVLLVLFCSSHCSLFSQSLDTLRCETATTLCPTPTFPVADSDSEAQEGTPEPETLMREPRTSGGLPPPMSAAPATPTGIEASHEKQSSGGLPIPKQPIVEQKAQVRHFPNVAPLHSLFDLLYSIQYSAYSIQCTVCTERKHFAPAADSLHR